MTSTAIVLVPETRDERFDDPEWVAREFAAILAASGPLPGVLTGTAPPSPPAHPRLRRRAQGAPASPLRGRRADARTVPERVRAPPGARDRARR